MVNNSMALHQLLVSRTTRCVVLLGCTNDRRRKKVAHCAVLKVKMIRNCFFLRRRMLSGEKGPTLGKIMTVLGKRPLQRKQVLMV